MPQLIKSLPVTGLNLLGVGGQNVIDTHRQLRNLLTERFGPEHGLLLAAPKRDGSGPIDWYTPDGLPEGAIRQLTALPEAERTRVRAALESKLEAIRADAAELMASPDERRAKLGERLDKATRFPDDRFVFLVGEQPVIVCWGTREERADTSVPPLEGYLGQHQPQRKPTGTAQTSVEQAPAAERPMAPAPTPTAPTPPTSTLLQTAPYYVLREGFPWGALLAMLLLFVFLAGIVRTLVPACGVDGWVAPWDWRNVWCNQAVAAVREDDGETARLQAELDRLRTAVAANPCPPPEPPPAPVPEPPPPPPRAEQPTESTERVTSAGGKIGEVNVILKWEGRTVDLDLHVHCPGGEQIYFGNRKACGGELDVDMNSDRYSETPVENIVFPEGKIGKGRYRVRVNHFGPSGVRTPFEVIVRIKGKETRHPGVTSGSGDVDVTTFEVD